MQVFSGNRIAGLGLFLFTSIICNKIEFSDFPSKKYKEENLPKCKLQELGFVTRLELDDETLALFDQITEMLKNIGSEHYEYFEDLLTAAIMSRNPHNIRMVAEIIVEYYEKLQKNRIILYRLEIARQYCLIYEAWLNPKLLLVADNCFWLEILKNNLKDIRKDQTAWGYMKGFVGGWTLLATKSHPIFALAAGGSAAYILSKIEADDKIDITKTIIERKQIFKVHMRKTEEYMEACLKYSAKAMQDDKCLKNYWFNSFMKSVFDA